MKKYIIINKLTHEIFTYNDTKESIHKLVNKIFNYVELNIQFEFKIEYKN